MSAPPAPPLLPRVSGEARLEMPDQPLDRPFRDPAAPGLVPLPGVARARAVLAAIVAACSAAMLGLTFAVLGAEAAATVRGTAILALTLPLVALLSSALGTAVLGLLAGPPRPPAPGSPDAPGLSVAILVTLHGEPPREAIGPAVALLARLAAAPGRHRFALRLLSDTRDPDAAGAEAAVARALADRHPGLDIAWRRRATNRDFKPGNIRAWVQAEGHRFDAMLVLDADSTMAPAAVRQLADGLADDPGCGLVQSLVAVRPGETLWQRLQAFSAGVHGITFGRGLAAWTGHEGNYFGHNALLRTAAFAAAAGLPRLRGRRGSGAEGTPILSHDFVEAALLRRAGWGVRLAEVQGSDEAAPATLPAHVRRDRRWCRGNLQHLRLLAVPGLHPVSRLHLATGAAAYLAPPLWLGLAALWATVPGGGGPGAAMLVAGTVALLVGPRLVSAAAWLRDRGGLSRGRRAAFAGALAAEIAVTALAAPVLMAHQLRAALAAATGSGGGGWAPHRTDRPGVAALLRFHGAETAAGVALTAAVAAGAASPWLLPVAVPLMLAVPLARAVQRAVRPGLLAADGREPGVAPQVLAAVPAE